MDEQNVAARLDLSGVACPHNAARALIKLAGMAPGEILEIVIDDGEPYANVPRSLRGEGHRIVREERCGERWRLWIERE
jgi:TusA-related sulfurtransferase